MGKAPLRRKMPVDQFPNLASADVLAVFKTRVSPDKGTTPGSTHTHVFTHFIEESRCNIPQFIVSSGDKPTFLREKAWLRPSVAPQTHFVGVRERGQLNLKSKASKNSCLVSTWSLSSRGKLVSHLEGPDSRAISLTCF